MSEPLAIELPDELLETLAERVADLLDQRGHERPSANVGYLDVGGAAEFLACGSSRIYSLVSAKRIPHHRDGSRLLFNRAELRDYIDHGGARRP